MEIYSCKNLTLFMRQCNFHLKINWDTLKRRIIISRAVLGQQKYFVSQIRNFKFSRSHH